MIERDEKLKATIAYLKNDFTLTDKDSAELVKIVYDDGRIVFAVPSKLKRG